MAEELTDSQIELLCEIEEHDPTTLTGEKGRDLERLPSGGYVTMKSSPRAGLQAHRQGECVSRRARRRIE